MAAPAPAVELHAVGPCTLGTVLWRLQGALNVSVLVKGTFAFAPDAAMTVAEPEDIVRADAYFGDNPTRSTRLGTDLVPSLPRADIVLTGHACAPAGAPAPALSVRLVVFRDAPLVDKAILVRGDVAANGEFAPFERIPLVYERAYGGVAWDENPFGKGADASGSPNLVDPRSPRRTACFAPIPRGYPQRTKLLGGFDRRALDKPILEIPQGFDWTYFQSAPEDQRSEYLHGTEWVVLERMTADPTYVRSHLPGARGYVRIAGLPSVPEDRPVPLAADTLRIDADQLRCSVVWRRSFPVASLDEVARLRIQGAVQLGATPVEWPALPAAKPSRSPALGGTVDLPADEPPRERGNFTGTMLIEPEAPKAPAVPFKPGPAVLPVSKSRPPDDGDRAGSGTIGPFDPVAAVAAPARSMPFPRAPTTPPPAGAKAQAIPVVSAPPVVSAGASEERAPETTPLLDTRGPSPGDEPAPIARRFDRTPSTPAPAPPPAQPAFGVPPAAVPTFTGAAPAGTFAPVVAPAAPVFAPAAPAFGAPQPVAKAAPPGVTLVNTTTLAFEATPWGLSPSRDCFVVVAKASATIVPGGPAKLRDASDALSGERFAEAAAGRVLVYPSDRAPFKVRADVVATAYAHPPKGPTPSLDVRFAFGAPGNAFDRAVTVFGDRRWEKRGNLTVATAPEAFLRMALGWERAFGGKGHPTNPAGLGLSERTRKGPTPLPNLEDPNRRLRTVKQSVPPVAFAPIPLAWRDAAARAEPRASFPLFPEELDWTRYQAAPPEQQLAFLRGDEPFALHGMSRAHPEISGALPGVRARAFAVAGDRVEDVPLRLDTVVFTVEEMRIDLVFRGALPVVDERAPESVALHLLTEPVASPPMTVEDARAKLRRN